MGQGHEPYPDEVSQRLKRIMADQGLSVHELSCRAGVSRHSLYAYLSGRRRGWNMSLAMGVRLAVALGLSMDVIVARWEPPPQREPHGTNERSASISAEP